MATKKTIKRCSVKEIKAKVQALKATRGVWENHWQELTDHILPRKNTINITRTDGEKRTWQLLDNSGVHSNELLAGALHGLMTNPDLPWFELTTGNEKMDAEDEVRGWLQRTARKMHNVMNNSNFQTEVHELYLDLGCIGTACMQVEEDEKDVVRYTTNFIAEYYIDESPYGFVDQVYREWKWSPAQIIARFGEKNVSPKVLKSYKKGEECKYTVGQAVYPAYIVKDDSEGDRKLAQDKFIVTGKQIGRAHV